MKRTPRTIRLACAMAVAGALLAGCGLLGDTKNGREAVAGMDMQGAAERADAIFYTTVAAIKPEIEWVHGTTTTGSCDVTRYWTVMTVVSDQRRGNFLGVVESFWKASGYRIKTVNPSKDMPEIYARSPDGFGIMVTFGHAGQAFFEVTSPCVHESKVAAPTKVANGRTYEGDIPTPNVRSDFWSADTPAPGPHPFVLTSDVAQGPTPSAAGLPATEATPPAAGVLSGRSGLRLQAVAVGLAGGRDGLVLARLAQRRVGRGGLRCRRGGCGRRGRCGGRPRRCRSCFGVLRLCRGPGGRRRRGSGRVS